MTELDVAVRSAQRFVNTGEARAGFGLLEALIGMVMVSAAHWCWRDRPQNASEYVYQRE
jgi:hypothetical protein